MYPQKPSLTFLLLLGQILAGSAQVPQQFSYSSEDETPVADVKEIAKTDRLMQSFIHDNKVSSAVGFVARGGEVVYSKAFGWKDVENKTPASVDDYYVLFSQTKAITSVAFMTLVEKGLVSIDDPVSKYFPGIPDQMVIEVKEDGGYETRPVKTPMTFVHLLSHTSGLNAGLVGDIKKAQKKGDERPSGFGGMIPDETPAGQHSGGGDYTSEYLEQEMMALAKYPLGFDPGSKWSYHVSSNMLGYLIERISGKSLREYVKETVLDPLGMTETDWYYRPAALPRFVKPYRSVDGSLEPGSTIYSDGTISDQQTYCEGAIGLNGPIKDYAKFCQMLLNRGTFNGHRVLQPETIELMTSINRIPENSGAAEGFQFGLGLELHREVKPVPAVSDSAFAWGGMLGTAYLIDPEYDLVVLFYINMFGAAPVYPEFLAQAYRMCGLPEVASGKEISPLGEVSVIIEEGGTGDYPAVVTEDPSLPGMTLFHPKNMSAFGEEQRLPILLWGNGACANTTQEHKNFLNEIASNGYMILAIGLLDQIHERDGTSRLPTSSDQLIQALDWALEQNETEGSGYFGKLDPEQIAVMGMSCGGLQAIEISGDPRIRTTVVCNSGVLPEPSPLKGMPSLSKDALKDYHSPVLYIMGGPSDIAYNNAMDDFSRVNQVPIVMTNLDVGHGGTYHQPHGGEFTKVALAWLDWQLKDESSASKMFLGEKSELREDPKWTIEVKNFE